MAECFLQLMGVRHVMDMRNEISTLLFQLSYEHDRNFVFSARDQLGYKLCSLEDEELLIKMWQGSWEEEEIPLYGWAWCMMTKFQLTVPRGLGNSGMIQLALPLRGPCLRLEQDRYVQIDGKSVDWADFCNPLCLKRQNDKYTDAVGRRSRKG